MAQRSVPTPEMKIPHTKESAPNTPRTLAANMAPQAPRSNIHDGHGINSLKREEGRKKIKANNQKGFPTHYSLKSIK